MTTFAKVINKFGVESDVPLWKAKEMMLNGDIDTYEPVEVEHTNITEPESQVKFEDKLTKKK